MKVGVFGGTFSPPHITHIEMAEQAVSQLGLDKLFILPNGIPPHKYCRENKLDRLNMAKLAFDGLSKTVIDTYEIDKQGESYTYQTLLRFKDIYPNDDIYLIIGGDSLRDFETWKNPDKIAGLAGIAVCQRKGNDYENDKVDVENRYNAKVVEVKITQSEISSTKIRVDYQFGIDCTDRVPKQVDEYIVNRGLYSYYGDYVEKLRQMLKPSRFKHTYYTTLTGEMLPSKCDKDKVFLACLLHDCAKNMSPSEYAKYGFTPDKNMPEGILHAPLGALVAEKEFGVTDSEILDAIRYHTTARPNMTELDMVVYTADKIEESRPYPVKHLYADTLEETFTNCLLEAAEYVSKRLSMTSYYGLTKQAIDFYLNKRRNK
ncbi:MAG TPA: nicotinate (nicotinamide) nucleotide adenylyltransferase [Eubacteriales bacterium]|nr:nicotinate (nicotinamide) nucleotide adenylyltransferase [Eubacteriales bacterium]